MRGRRVASVALVLAAVYLVASAAPVAAASTNLAVASIHTNATDFNSATLTNMTVEGSGDSATVGVSLSTVDDFEDGDTNIERSVWTGWTEDAGTGTLTAQQGTVLAGSWSGRINATGGNFSNWLASRGSTDTPTNVSVLVQATQNGNSADGAELRLLTGGSIVGRLRLDGDGGVSVNGNPVTGTWSEATTYRLKFHNIDYSNNQFDWRVVRVSDDTVIASDTNQAFQTNTANVDGIIIQADANSDAQGIDGFFDEITWGVDGQTPAEYINNHTAENTVQGFLNVTENTNATVTVTYRGDSNGDGSFDTLLNQTSGVTTAANHTFTWSAFGGDNVQVNVTVQNASGNGDPAFTLADEGVQWTNHRPTVDNSSASPTGELSSSEVTFEIQVNDSDFPLAQGDSVDAVFSLDGAAVGTDTLTNNGTASVSTTISNGGSHDWNVTVTDEHGLTVTSQTFSIEAPANLSIRKELAPDDLVNETTVNITAYHGDEVERRTVTDGNMSLSGFPLNQSIIVRANASGYYTRTMVIESVFDQSDMYLLNSTTPTYLIRFDLQDPTGNYPRDDTVLFVERDLNQSGAVEWRVIAGDNFGVRGVPTDLEQEERYRLRIKNLESGDQNVIGAYTAIQSETVTINAGSAIIEVPTSSANYSWAVTENETGQYVLVEYNDTADQTESVKITIHERFNESTVIADNVTFTGSNNLVYQQMLTADQVNKSWMVVLYIDRGDGYMRFREPATGGQYSIIPVDLDQTWVTGIGVFIVLITAMAFSNQNQGVGAITTAIVGGVLLQLGVLAEVTTGAAIVAALAISVVFKYQQSGGR